MGIADDIAGLIGKGVEILAVQEDLTERGLGETGLIDGVETINRSGLAKLLDRHDQVWHW